MTDAEDQQMEPQINSSLQGINDVMVETETIEAKMERLSHQVEHWTKVLANPELKVTPKISLELSAVRYACAGCTENFTRQLLSLDTISSFGSKMVKGRRKSAASYLNWLIDRSETLTAKATELVQRAKEMEQQETSTQESDVEANSDAIIEESRMPQSQEREAAESVENQMDRAKIDDELDSEDSQTQQPSTAHEQEVEEEGEQENTSSEECYDEPKEKEPTLKSNEPQTPSPQQSPSQPKGDNENLPLVRLQSRLTDQGSHYLAMIRIPTHINIDDISFDISNLHRSRLLTVAGVLPKTRAHHAARFEVPLELPLNADLEESRAQLGRDAILRVHIPKILRQTRVDPWAGMFPSHPYGVPTHRDVFGGFPTPFW